MLVVLVVVHVVVVGVEVLVVWVEFVVDVVEVVVVVVVINSHTPGPYMTTLRNTPLLFKPSKVPAR